jgi:tRNA wybutosine-synthesizing protein 4
VDVDRFPLYRASRPVETVLEPGDVLFIPSCWIHAVSALEPSISVNCFFRGQDASLMQKADVFENADLLPFERARAGVAETIGVLEQLRPEQRSFYLQKLAMELMELAD